MTSVDSLWLHPVKSMLGTSVATAAFDEYGMVGDRIVALRDLRLGRLAGLRQYPMLARCRADVVDDTVVVTLPDGQQLSIDDPGAATAVGEVLGTDVAIERLAPATQLDAFRRRPDPEAAADPMGYLRTILGREADEPLPDFAKFGPFVAEFETPPGSFVD
jgi:uncharacterized protein YcbX